MKFRPPASYIRLRDNKLIKDETNFWYDVNWCPVMRWVEREPARLTKHEATQPIGDYYVFAVTGGGDPWCWHAGVPTTTDEFEIHQVDLFMYIPVAPTFETFLLRRHLRGIVGRDKDWPWYASQSASLLGAVLSRDALSEVNAIEQRVQKALRNGESNPFHWDDFYAVIERRLGAKYVHRS